MPTTYQYNNVECGAKQKIVVVIYFFRFIDCVYFTSEQLALAHTSLPKIPMLRQEQLLSLALE